MSRETYEMKAACRNCGHEWGAVIPLGVPLCELRCLNCDCFGDVHKAVKPVPFGTDGVYSGRQTQTRKGDKPNEET